MVGGIQIMPRATFTAAPLDGIACPVGNMGADLRMHKCLGVANTVYRYTASMLIALKSTFIVRWALVTNARTLVQRFKQK